MQFVPITAGTLLSNIQTICCRSKELTEWHGFRPVRASNIQSNEWADKKVDFWKTGCQLSELLTETWKLMAFNGTMFSLYRLLINLVNKARGSWGLRSINTVLNNEYAKEKHTWMKHLRTKPPLNYSFLTAKAMMPSKFMGTAVPKCSAYVIVLANTVTMIEPCGPFLFPTKEDSFSCSFCTLL